ncbi:MAG: hypothetical protein U1E32_02830 [Rhodoglobus sp.]|nr:hypothetical protein [Rhodoglobus sp.]
MIVFNLDGSTVILLLTFVVSVLLPLLVGIVTTRVTSPARNAVVLVVLSFITSVLSEILTALVNQTPYDLVAGIFKFAGIAVIAIASYFGVWSRPTSDGQSVARHLVDDVGRKA